MFIFFCGFLRSIVLAAPRVHRLRSGSTSYSVYNGNKKLWEIHAERAKGNSHEIKAFSIKGILYRNKKTAYYLTSLKAVLNLRSGNVFFPDGVLLYGKNGEVIQVHWLVWSKRQKRFIGTKGIRVIRRHSVLQGDEMVLKKNFKNLVLQGNVKVKLLPQ
jgi:hypothetical protein